MSVAYTEQVSARREQSATQITPVARDWPFPHHLAHLVDRLVQLRMLGPGWDGYGSAPIRPLAFERAVAIVLELGPKVARTATIVPVPGGGLQFEWEKDGNVLEVEVLPDGATAFAADFQDGDIVEGSISSARIPMFVQAIESFLD